MAVDLASRIEECISRVAAGHELSESLLSTPDERTTEITGPDWGALPIRIARCLPRRQTLEVLDWRSEQGDEGRKRLQEEYLEWRVVQDEHGRLTRVEMTTELPDYWRSLASWDPALTVDLVSELARESVTREAVYGDLNPFGAGVSAQDREEAFATTMLAPRANSPYNDGRKAICCMVHPTNGLEDLVELVARSAAPYAVEDPVAGGLRCASAAEVLPVLGNAAQAGRSSDPVLVERFVRLAFEGRLVALANPVGVFIAGVEYTRLRQPNGDLVPPDWFHFERNALPADANKGGAALYQRLTLEVPEGEGLMLSDLVDVATEEPVHFGGQIADLVQLVTFVNTSPAGVVAADPIVLKAATEHPDEGCMQLEATYVDFVRSSGAGAPGDVG